MQDQDYNSPTEVVLFGMTKEYQQKEATSMKKKVNWHRPPVFIIIPYNEKTCNINSRFVTKINLPQYFLVKH